MSRTRPTLSHLYTGCWSSPLTFILSMSTPVKPLLAAKLLIWALLPGSWNANWLLPGAKGLVKTNHRDGHAVRRALGVWVATRRGEQGSSTLKLSPREGHDLNLIAVIAQNFTKLLVQQESTVSITG